STSQIFTHSLHDALPISKSCTWHYLRFWERSVQYLHPILLQASLHETIWGGRRLERNGWKQLPPGNKAIGESWETELNTVAQNRSEEHTSELQSLAYFVC